MKMVSCVLFVGSNDVMEIKIIIAFITLITQGINV